MLPSCAPPPPRLLPRRTMYHRPQEFRALRSRCETIMHVAGSGPRWLAPVPPIRALPLRRTLARALRHRFPNPSDPHTALPLVVRLARGRVREGLSLLCRRGGRTRLPARLRRLFPLRCRLRLRGFQTSRLRTCTQNFRTMFLMSDSSSRLATPLRCVQKLSLANLGLLRRRTWTLSPVPMQRLNMREPNTESPTLQPGKIPRTPPRDTLVRSPGLSRKPSCGTPLL